MFHSHARSPSPHSVDGRTAFRAWLLAFVGWLASLLFAPAVSAQTYEPAGCECGCDAPVSCQPLTTRFSTSGTSWVRLEYLDWTISGSDAPPLLRTSPSGTPAAQTGVLGRAGQTLFGGDDTEFTQSGVRLAGGWWFDHNRRQGIEISYAALPQSSDTYRFDSLSYPHLARPVFDTEAGVEASMLIAHPDFLSGSATIRQTSEFHHIEALRRDLYFQDQCRRVDTLIGLRYASLEDSLMISQSSLYTAASGVILPGTRRDLFDRFEATNRFHGIVLGLDYTEQLGILQIRARGTLGLGNSRADVLVAGQTQTSVPGDGTAIFDGGLLAQSSNIGQRSKSRFAIMPEAYLGVSTQLNRCWELKAGYQVIYWDQVAQAVDQIDHRVSQFPPEPITGQGAPSARLRRGDVLIHGLQVGASFTF